MVSTTPPFSFSLSSRLAKQDGTPELVSEAASCFAGTKRLEKENLMVKTKINGRIFTLTWAEFEKAFFSKGVTTSVEILEVI